MAVRNQRVQRERLDVYGKREDGTSVSFYAQDSFTTDKQALRRAAKKHLNKIANDTVYVKVDSGGSIEEFKS